MATEHFLRPLLTSQTRSAALYNTTRGALIVSRLQGAFDSVTRRRGLLGRSRLIPSEALAIAPCNAVHTFGMKFPIDILFVDRRGRVLKRVIALKRGRIAASFCAFAVIELAAHHPGLANMEVGDMLAVGDSPEQRETAP